MRALMEAVGDNSDQNTAEKHESDSINKHDIYDETNAPVRKPQVPWKFGRRRSLSPLSRVQGMIEDQDKNDK